MLKVKLLLCCDLCKREMARSTVCFDRTETTAWKDVDMALKAEMKKQRWKVSKKSLCTPCVMDIENETVCILP